jgi:diguanylate cyclase (GGDEF)-like protein
MGKVTEPPVVDAREGRFSPVRFLMRLVLMVAIPVIALGAALWWLVGQDGVDRAVELQAASNHRLVDSLIGDALGDLGDQVAVVDPELYWSNRKGVMTSVLGDHHIEFVDPGGRILVSDERSDGPGPNAVVYSLPWAPSNSPTAGIIRLTVLDDRVVAATADGLQSLGWLFGGAFLALLLALGPLCWWSLGAVRTQLRRTRVLALNDSLTGLANRTQFHDRLDEAIAAAKRGSGKVGLIMVDLDGFKAINDTGGHAAGDRLLKRVAAGLEDATRRNEIACRLGGDEFAVVVPRLGDREELVGLADRLHERLDMVVPFADGRSLRVTASLGLSVFPDDAAGADDLVGVADRGMYGVKAARRAQLARVTNTSSPTR